MTGAGHRLGVDLGGTKIEIVALTDDGAELGRIRVPTPRGDYGGTIAAVRDLIVRAEHQWGPARSVGVGTPGAIDPGTGLLKNSNSTVLNGEAVAVDLVEALGRDVRLRNDADCLALSEYHDGAAAGSDPVFAAILGTGVGGGIVANGRLVNGPNAISGEWGHTPLVPGPGDFEAVACWCGRERCMETFLSGGALAADFAARSGIGVSGEEVVGRAGDRDPAALAAIGAYAARLGRALAGVINLIDPEVVVLGGGLSNISALYELVPEAWGPFVFSETVATRLVPARFGDASGARGAARLWD